MMNEFLGSIRRNYLVPVPHQNACIEMNATCGINYTVIRLSGFRDIGYVYIYMPRDVPFIFLKNRRLYYIILPYTFCRSRSRIMSRIMCELV